MTVIQLKNTKSNIKLTAPTVSGVSVDLSNYYTKEQTDEKIQAAVDNIDIPEVDLTGYATESFVDTRVAQDTQATQNWANQTFVTKEDWELVIPAFLTKVPDEYTTQEEVIALIAEYGGGTLPASEEGEF